MQLQSVGQQEAINDGDLVGELQGALAVLQQRLDFVFVRGCVRDITVEAKWGAISLGNGLDELGLRLGRRRWAPGSMALRNVLNSFGSTSVITISELPLSIASKTGEREHRS